MRYLLSLLLVFGVVFAQDSACSEKSADNLKKIEVKKEIKDGKVLVTVTENGKTEVHEFDVDNEEAMAKIHAKIEADGVDGPHKIKVIKKIKEHDCKKENCDPATCEHALKTECKETKLVKIHKELKAHDCTKENCDPKTCEYALKGECDKEAMAWHMKDKGDLKKMKILKKGKMHEDHFFIDGKGGFLGVQIQDLTEELSKKFKVKDNAGVLVVEVVEDSPAEKSGLKEGDIITKVDDKVVKNGSDLTELIRSYEPETKIAISMLRKGKKKQLKAQLGEAENNYIFNFGNLKDFDEDQKMFLKMHPGENENFEFHKFPFDQEELRMEMDELRKELKELKAELKKLQEEK